MKFIQNIFLSILLFSINIFNCSACQNPTFTANVPSIVIGQTQAGTYRPLLNFSPDGQYIATISQFPGIPNQPNQVIVYPVDTATGNLNTTAYAQSCELGISLSIAAFSPDQKYIAVGNNGTANQIHILDFSRPNEQCTQNPTPTGIFELGTFPLITGANVQINDIKYSPDGRYLAVAFVEFPTSGSPISRLYIYDVISVSNLSQKLPITTIQSENFDSIQSIAWSPNSQNITFGGNYLTSIPSPNPRLLIYNVNGIPAGSKTFSGSNGVTVSSIIYSPNGQYLAMDITNTGSSDPAGVYVFNALNLNTPIFAPVENAGSPIVFSQDSRYLYLWSTNLSIFASISIPGGGAAPLFSPGTKPVGISLSPYGNALAYLQTSGSPIVNLNLRTAFSSNVANGFINPTFAAGCNSATGITLTPDAVTQSYTVSWTGPNFTTSSAGSIIAQSSGIYSLNLISPIDSSCGGGSKLVYVNTTPVITQQPADELINVGQQASFEVNAVSPNLGIQWQQIINGSGINITGATNPIYSFLATTGDSGKQFQAILQNTQFPQCMTGSNIATLTVGGTVTPVGPITLCPGQTQVLTANGPTSATYQWQRSTDNITYNNIVGANQNVYTVTTSGYYRALINSVASNSVQVTIKSTLVPTITPSGTVQVNQGGSQELTATAGYPTYRWFRDGAFFNTGESITVSTAGNYTVQITDAEGCVSQMSAATTIDIVNPNIEFEIIPSSATVALGGNATFTAHVISGDVDSFEWTGPDGFQATGSSITLSNINAQQYGVYICTARNSVTQKTVSAQLIQPSPGNIELEVIPSSATVFLGDNVEFTAHIISGQVDLIEWTGPNGFYATGNSIVLTNININQYGTYFCTASNSTNQRTVSVQLNQLLVPLELEVVPNAASVELGGTATFTAKIVSGIASAIEWTGPNGFHATGDSITISNVSIDQYGVYYCTASNRGAKVTVPVQLVQKSLISATITTSNNMNFLGQKVTLTVSAFGGAGNYLYIWRGPNNFAFTTSDPTLIINALDEDKVGEYEVDVRDSNGVFGSARINVVGVRVVTINPNMATNDEQKIIVTSSTLQVEVLGGAGPYSYDWSYLKTAPADQSLTPIKGNSIDNFFEFPKASFSTEDGVEQSRTEVHLSTANSGGVNYVDSSVSNLDVTVLQSYEHPITFGFSAVCIVRDSNGFGIPVIAPFIQKIEDNPAVIAKYGNDINSQTRSNKVKGHFRSQNRAVLLQSALAQTLAQGGFATEAESNAKAEKAKKKAQCIMITVCVIIGIAIIVALLVSTFVPGASILGFGLTKAASAALTAGAGAYLSTGVAAGLSGFYLTVIIAAATSVTAITLGVGTYGIVNAITNRNQNNGSNGGTGTNTGLLGSLI